MHALAEQWSTPVVRESSKNKHGSITLKKQLWMADKDEFSHLKSRITKVKRLTLKYKNQPLVEEFMRA